MKLEHFRILILNTGNGLAMENQKTKLTPSPLTEQEQGHLDDKAQEEEEEEGKSKAKLTPSPVTKKGTGTSWRYIKHIEIKQERKSKLV